MEILKYNKFVPEISTYDTWTYLLSTTAFNLVLVVLSCLSVVLSIA